MKVPEQTIRMYVKKRFPRASRSEREKIVHDWLTKEHAAEGIARDFERRVAPLSDMRVLDAGSGNGGVSIALARHGALVEGVDIEQELVDIARMEAALSGVRASFTCYDGTRLPFADDSFDAAISVSVIEHVDDPVNYFSELLRVVKSGGHLYLAFPNRLHPKETHTGLWGLSYLPTPLARLYVSLMKRNPLEDNGLHFYSYWRMMRFVHGITVADKTWQVCTELGTSSSIIIRVSKWILRICNIPHQALLPHVMLVFRASK